jgi:hypothetical protein
VKTGTLIVLGGAGVLGWMLLRSSSASSPALTPAQQAALAAQSGLQPPGAGGGAAGVIGGKIAGVAGSLAGGPVGVGLSIGGQLLKVLGAPPSVKAADIQLANDAAAKGAQVSFVDKNGVAHAWGTDVKAGDILAGDDFRLTPADIAAGKTIGLVRDWRGTPPGPKSSAPQTTPTPINPRNPYGWSL